MLVGGKGGNIETHGGKRQREIKLKVYERETSRRIRERGGRELIVRGEREVAKWERISRVPTSLAGNKVGKKKREGAISYEERASVPVTMLLILGVERREGR